MTMKPRGLRLCMLGCLAGAMAACGGINSAGEQSSENVGDVGQAVYARNFGMHCTGSYQNDWLPAQTDGVQTCNNFGSKLSATATQKFYYNLKSKQYYWHDTGDQATNSLEDVDLFFSDTHGGAWTGTYSEYAMWDDSVLATTDKMRLGDEGRGLSIFAVLSCHTLQSNDGAFWGRWGKALSGGLRATLGSHGEVFIGLNAPAGTQFASLLNQGSTFKSAWASAFGSTAAANDLAVAFTGTTLADCQSRRDNMTWNNFMNYPRVRDGSIGYWCGWEWTDV